MGSYTPAVLVKDAQRHGLRVKPIDAQVSDWACTIEREPDGSLSLRFGLGYARGCGSKPPLHWLARVSSTACFAQLRIWLCVSHS
jgi:DNA polymerase III alpha subunit